jgi:gas vesicle protein
MRYFGHLIMGAMVGGALGSVLALLLAPTSGVQMRERIKETVFTIRDDIETAAFQRRVELEQQLAHLRQPPALE